MPPADRRAQRQAPAELASAASKAANASARDSGSSSRIRSNDRTMTWLARKSVTPTATRPAAVPTRRSLAGKMTTGPAPVARAGVMLGSSFDASQLRTVDEFAEKWGPCLPHTHVFGQGRTNPGSGSVTSPRRPGEPPGPRRLVLQMLTNDCPSGHKDVASLRLVESQRLISWMDWYRFARRELGYTHGEAVAYANLRSVEDSNKRARAEVS